MRSWLKWVLVLLILINSVAKADTKKELVSINFPEPTNIRDIIRTVALWTEKNVIIGRRVRGRVQIIAPSKVTKEEAYQAFLAALDMLNLTTVETGKVIKIIPTRKAYKSNLKIYQGNQWAPATSNMITQIVPLKYISASRVRRTLSRLISSRSLVALKETNTLIISDTGFLIRRILGIIQLLDVAENQPHLELIVIKHRDAKKVSQLVKDLVKTQMSLKNKRRRRSRSKVIVDNRTNSIAIFGTTAIIAQVKEYIKKIDQSLYDNNTGRGVRVRFLNYSNAKKIANTLNNLINTSKQYDRRRYISRRRRSKKNNKKTVNLSSLKDNVQIGVDESMNALIIRGSKSSFDALNLLINKLDRKQPQVYLKMNILDLNLNNSFIFGTSFITSKGGDATTTLGWQGRKVAPLISASSNTASSISNTDKLNIAKALAQDFTIGLLSGTKINIPGLGKVSPGGLINMLKSDGNSRLLSSPHILTLNNEEASITVGDTLFFKTSQSSLNNDIDKVEKEEADLTLEVKPNISHSGKYVTLKVDIEANEGSIDPATGLPNINKRQTDLTVTLANGNTAVISGLNKTRENRTHQKIPLLGDIPLLGWLFRNTRSENIKSSLLITITPQVIYGGNDLRAVYEREQFESKTWLKEMFTN